MEVVRRLLGVLWNIPQVFGVVLILPTQGFKYCDGAVVMREPEVDAVVQNLHACQKVHRVVKVMANPFKVSPEDGIWERPSARHEWVRVNPGEIPTRNRPLHCGKLAP